MSTLSGNRYFEISTEETSLNDFVLNRKGSAILSPVSTNMWDAQITQ
jgi:hypothetical protein